MWEVDPYKDQSKLKGQNSRTSQGPKIAVFKYQKHAAKGGGSLKMF